MGSGSCATGGPLFPVMSTRRYASRNTSNLRLKESRLTPRQFGFMHEVLKSGFATALGKVKNLGGVSGHSGSAIPGVLCEA